MPMDCRILRSGGPDALKIREVPRVPCGPRQARVKVAFVGVNFADLAARAGLYAPAPRPPFTPGFEVAGTLVEVGAESALEVGMRVLAVTRFGGYTSEVV